MKYSIQNAFLLLFILTCIHLLFFVLNSESKNGNTSLKKRE